MDKLIMECTQPRVFVLVNGILRTHFRPERDIRQRDLISQYVFTICASYLDK